ncbi:uncharacterized protein LOC107627666 [Arachis ipaensis]|uniref:uncharacterized protein LOC107627666 n=1 Tax=Arachis ipaensis TaxID=130454 RepID=UPI0007AF8089|nr:uncharacterized protein LOC107627666 [Arachis ipaensis]
MGVCYYCGGPRHLSWNCLERKRQETEGVQQQGCVFTMSADGVERSDTLIRDNCEMAGKTLIALFDTGASHSFIAFEKASELGLKIVMLAYDLEVDTAISEAIVTRSLQFMSKGSEGQVVANGYYLNSLMVNCSESECSGFILLATSVSEDEKILNQIPVVNEFLEVFLEGITEFPPSQKIEFAIELVPRAGLISIAPY